MSMRACDCGCGRDFEIDDAPRPGRPRRYYSRACRKRAQRQRDMHSQWVPALEGELHVTCEPPTKQVANAVAETAVVAAAFRRLAVEEPSPRLAAGCESMYLEIIAALERNFPGWSA